MVSYHLQGRGWQRLLVCWWHWKADIYRSNMWICHFQVNHKWSHRKACGGRTCNNALRPWIQTTDVNKLWSTVNCTLGIVKFNGHSNIAEKERESPKQQQWYHNIPHGQIAYRWIIRLIISLNRMDKTFQFAIEKCTTRTPWPRSNLVVHSLCRSQSAV